MKKQMSIITACAVSAVIMWGCSKEEQHDGYYEINEVDRQFVLGATLGNAAEIVLSQIAADSSETASITEFGELMILHHSKAHTELKAMAGGLRLYAPDSVDAQHSALAQQLLEKKGRELDSLYIHNQVADHQATIALYEAELLQGANTRLRKYAYSLLPQLRSHLDSATKIAAQY